MHLVGVQRAEASNYCISMRPIDVTPIADKLLNTVYSSVKTIALARFKVDNSVRVNKFKMIFEKDYTPNWTTEMFKIVKVQRTNPITYLLENYRGKPVTERFYEYELHRVANSDVYLIKRYCVKKEVYVKWLGFDHLHNSGYTRKMYYKKK